MGLIMDQLLITMTSGDEIINILHGVSEVKTTESPLCLEMYKQYNSAFSYHISI